MSSLLISMLGGAPPGEERPGHKTATFRLPGAGRIVETSNLGVELACAMKVSRLVLVGTSSAYFEKLVELLDASDQEAPVPEAQAQDVAPPPAEAGEATEASSRLEESQAGGSAGGDPHPTQGAPEAADPAGGPPADAPDQAVEVEGEAGPQPGSEDTQAETAGTGPAAAETAVEPPPETGTEPRPEPTGGPPEGGGPVETRAREAPPLKHHEPDTRPLRERLAAQAATGHPDKDALASLGQRLASRFGMAEVQCLLVSAPTDDRSFQATMRNLTELPREQEEVHVDVTHSDGLMTTVAFLALYYLKRLRPGVKTGDLLQGAPDHKDVQGHAPVLRLTAPFGVLDWIHSFHDLQSGHPTSELHRILNADKRLQALAGPYVRLQRGMQFGAASEVVQGARLLEERRRRLSRLPYSHRYRIFDPVLAEFLKPFSTGRPLSRLQLDLGRFAMAAGQPGFAAMYLREALLSHVLELFGQNPSRTWTEVPQSGGAQEVRMRDIAAYALTTAEARAKAPDLETAWPLLSEAKRHYLNVSSGMVPASQLKNADHEISRLTHMTLEILEKGVLAGLEETRTFEDLIKEAVDRMAIRPREPRRKGRRKGRSGGGPTGGGERGPRSGASQAGGARRGGRRDTQERPSRGPGHRDEGPRRRRRGGRDPEDLSPRVEKVGGGIGNLGLALAGAGLVEGDQPPQSEAPSSQGPGSPAATESTPAGPEPAEASGGETGRAPGEAAPQDQEAAEGTETGGSGSQQPAPGGEPRKEDEEPPEGGGSFDVAGPAGPPPA